MHFTIGTAGHIDHGKTTLIHALTGEFLDTHKDEIERGITISLGFSVLKIDELELGVVDVPGHEKLVKTMLAGVSGLDLILLVIAADDGVMPQTKEHLDILRYLEKTNIIPVLTKIDLVEKEQLQQRIKEVEALGYGSPELFLKGMDVTKIKSRIKSALVTKEMNDVEPFRYPIDRVFTKEGQGTITTGTAISGIVQVSDTLIHYPSTEAVKVRGIQMYHAARNASESHARVALELKTNTPIKKGDLLSSEELPETKLIDVMIQNPNHYVFHKGDLFDFYIFTTKQQVKLKLFGEKETDKDVVYAQLVLEKGIYVLDEDLGVLRTKNPAKTIAGVKVIRTLGEYVSNKDTSYLNHLIAITNKQEDQVYVRELSKHKWMKQEVFTNEFPTVDMSGLYTLGDYVFDQVYMQTLSDHLIKIVTEFHILNPYEKGIYYSTITKEFEKGFPKQLIKDFLETLDLDITTVVRTKDFQIKLTGEDAKIAKRVIEAVKTFTPLKKHELIQSKQDEQVLRALTNKGCITKISDEIYIDTNQLNLLKDWIKDFLQTNEVLSIGDVRDYTNASRSYIVSYLEYFDSIQFLRRTSAGRILK